MRARFFGVSSLTMLLMLPVLAAMFSSPMLQAVQAADACQGDTQAIEWNQTMQRMAEVPHYSGSYYPYYEPMYYEDDEDFGSPSPEQGGAAADGPEEPWMYQQNDWNLRALEPLETSHYTTMLIGNDSVGALRVNLSATHRTTVCITLQDLDSNPVEGDVYLLTTSEYESYVSSYECGHNAAWYCWDNGEVEETLSDIPPEWRSWNPLGWKSYRDAHEYERVTSVNFALNLDRPEVYTSIFGESDWQDFYIVVDAWDNIHDNDADAPGVTVAADVTIVTTSRSLILPSWTVALAFMGLLLGALVAPFIANSRYMKAGMGQDSDQERLVPSLEKPAELPGFQPGGNLSAPELPPPPSPHTQGVPMSPMVSEPAPVASTVPFAGESAMHDEPDEHQKSYDNPFDV